jgi:cytochrome c oxidase accessory protein FixG
MSKGPLPKPSLESVTTINEDGSRRFIHPADVSGRFTGWRALAGLVLMAVYVGLPWIPVGGNPAVFLDVANRQFHYFGWTLVTQDLWVGFFLITGLGFCLFYVTALLGRVWCGWACPQTVFLDIVRRIERIIEGDAPARRRLDAAPSSVAKFFKRGMKHAALFAFALVIAHVFLSYFVSLPRLYEMMHHSPRDNWPSFLLVFLMATALWIDFAWFREQFCIILCPYGRLQSALIDTDSLVIGYDTARGEPRGKAGTAGAGDCVDCNRCVTVCPTGIDIRQGLQIECIGCAACIDACDEVMTRLKRPTGLVRYDSQGGFAGKKRRFVRPRMIVYTVFALIGATAMTFAFSTLKPVTVSVVRLMGSPYVIEGGHVRNQFLVRILNKQQTDAAYVIDVPNAPESLVLSGAEGELNVPAQGEIMRPVVVTLPRDAGRGEMPLTMRVRSADGRVKVEKRVKFIGPDL